MVAGQSAKLRTIEMFAEVDETLTMDELNGNGKRGLPKLREILRRQKQDSEVFIAYLCLNTLLIDLTIYLSSRMRNPQISNFNMMMQTLWLLRLQRYYETST